MKTLYIIVLFLISSSLTYSQQNWDKFWIDKDWTLIPKDSIIQKRMKTATEPHKGMTGCNQIEFKDSANGLLFCWAGGRNTWVFKTTNGGKFWKETFMDDVEKTNDGEPIRPPGYMRNASVNGNQVIIPVQYNGAEKFDLTGYILRSTDFGDTFEKIVPDTGIGFMDMSMLNAKYGALLRLNSVLITNDSGKTWKESNIKPDSLEYFQFIQVVAENKIFVYRVWWQLPGSNANRIFYSSDNGNNWESITPPGFDIYKAHFFNENEGFILGCGVKDDKSTHDTLFVKYTYDRGKTWIKTWDTILSGQVRIYNKTIYDLKFYNRNNGIFLGEYGVIFQTTDGGKTWSFIGVKEDAPKGKSHFMFKRLAFIDKNTILTAGSVINSELMFVPLKTPVSVKEERREFKIDFFPNPTTDKIIFKQAISAYKIEIVDILGKVREVLSNVYNLEEINLSMLESGTYFINIYTDEGLSSNKIIKY